MNEHSELPAVVLTGGTAMADAFLARGVGTFAAACAWVQALPYGGNSRLDSPHVLFDEGRGTCMTKHGAIATLAHELRLDIHKHVGFYRLTDDVITGTGELLRPHGLSFVPSMHCFLMAGARRIDLTHGNRTGKNGDLHHFDAVVPVGAWVSRENLQHLYAQQFPYYCAVDPMLAAVGLGKVRELLQACHALAGTCRCAPSPVPIAVTAIRS
jgi:hypothetical protein